MKENYTMLDVQEISFDHDNPRIKMALEKYGDKINEERIHFALHSATEGAKSTSSFKSLKNAIRATKGIVTPIAVVAKNGKYLCIDGNTRLDIYKQLAKEHESEEWTKIKAVVLDNADQRDIESIRVSAHLVGAREWPAYEKARYLHKLRNEKFMDYDEMIALCGGNRKDIENQIEAYHDMNEYYRDLVDDAKFHIERYSGFVELQKSGVKEAIFDANLDLKDFGEWIRDGKIYRMDSVRDLPKVLRDSEARNVFLEGGLRSIEEAKNLLVQRKQENASEADKAITLEDASLFHLAEVLVRRINDLRYSDVQALRDREHEEAKEQISGLEELSVRLQRLLEDVSE